MNHEYVELWYFVKDNWFVLIAGISFFVGWACLIIKAASNGHVSDDCDDDYPVYYDESERKDYTQTINEVLGSEHDYFSPSYYKD